MGTSDDIMYRLCYFRLSSFVFELSSIILLRFLSFSFVWLSTLPHSLRLAYTSSSSFSGISTSRGDEPPPSKRPALLSFFFQSSSVSLGFSSAFLVVSDLSSSSSFVSSSSSSSYCSSSSSSSSSSCARCAVVLLARIEKLRTQQYVRIDRR